MKIGLVLEGGAMRGMYTAGVLDVFLENKIKVDGIIGVSAGVLFGVNYLSKQKGRVIRYNKKYSKDKRYMGLHSLVKTGNIINKDFAYYEVPTKLDVFDQKTYSESNIPFYATVTNVETGEAEYIKVDDVFLQMELLRATSAMPIVSRIVEIDGKKYLDGAIADSIPIDKMKELGYDKIIVVLTKPKGYKKKKRGNTLIKLFYRKYPMFARAMQNRYRNYNQTIDKISDMESQKEIFVIRPSREVKMSRIEKNPDKLQEMYDLGIKDCQNTIKDLQKYIRK